MGSAFRNLIAWQKSYELSLQIYKTTALFPKSEQYSLVDQMRRAVVSVSSNIAEGSGKGSNLDYSRFLKIARGSSLELESQILIAEGLGFLDKEKSLSLQDSCNEIQRILNTLIQKYKE
ncbi:four helix bundle protein [Candidatus Gracilibacteria bacterium]|nr:four helix bundle protein [Candidatus Gracilibacteria bacterium]